MKKNALMSFLSTAATQNVPTEPTPENIPDGEKR